LSSGTKDARHALASLAVMALALASLSALSHAQAAAKSVGSDAAPIAMQVFTNFECPACAAFHRETIRPLMRDYVATGKVRISFCVIAAPNRPAGRRAALYANAAARAGHFERVADALYETQRAWMETGDVQAAVATVLSPEEMKRVNAEMRSKIEGSLEADLALASALQIRSTPTTIITHRGEPVRLVGAVSYSILRLYLEKLLKDR
jgi:protein-disulfide isomerase